ncbi:hypothetical protein SF123566_9885 [Shigella flexneri 1235-66]|nr:hypothetical protein SF123566_9885 [Shigella flexneri 1235-66]
MNIIWITFIFFKRILNFNFCATSCPKTAVIFSIIEGVGFSKISEALTQ